MTSKQQNNTPVRDPSHSEGKGERPQVFLTWFPTKAVLCPSCSPAGTPHPAPCINSPSCTLHLSPKFLPYGFKLTGPCTARCSSPPGRFLVLLHVFPGAPSSHAHPQLPTSPEAPTTPSPPCFPHQDAKRGVLGCPAERWELIFNTALVGNG